MPIALETLSSLDMPVFAKRIDLCEKKFDISKSYVANKTPAAISCISGKMSFVTHYHANLIIGRATHN